MQSLTHTFHFENHTRGQQFLFTLFTQTPIKNNCQSKIQLTRLMNRVYPAFLVV
uniref:Uncharacterized protein n=1 Tax=Picea glauca TaxID=3330 RepID=A0A124GMG9_PICGL|nr:hypothetical protein ABT39_MTgene2487 [Picea glauca]KUM45670.1 hypothetical protein ABT39_MTgene2506 [Picea glauca]KUM45677.1 hypothetical protein ABT39_MTgene2513 [Picea glauca]